MGLWMSWSLPSFLRIRARGQAVWRPEADCSGPDGAVDRPLSFYFRTPGWEEHTVSDNNRVISRGVSMLCDPVPQILLHI